MVYVFLAEGFEEVEALTPVDLLRRAGVETQTVAVGKADKTVTGARGVTVVADITLDEADFDKAHLLVLPGGMPGTLNLAGCDKLMKKVDEIVKNGNPDKRVAAICAAPAKCLGQRGLLNNKKATCYPGMEGEMKGAEFTEKAVVTDGVVTTSRGMGTAAEFALELVRLMCGQEKADAIRKSVVA